MIDKFGNAFYLIIYLAHFIIVGSYAYQLVFDTKKFLKGRGVDKTATLITRFAGSFMIATVLMAIYIAFIRSGGCLLYTSPSPRDMRRSRMPSSA